ncbi:MAG: acetyl-CoA hydrolase/transferase C-terminal domain-containing protein [Caulobacter sp.]|nr:acetyl-CoA hydrolase/transferase C-terminal domain-containing protein [Caulobacter sp.]
MIRLTVESAAESITQRLNSGGGRVFIPGGSSEPVVLLDLYRRRPDLAAGLTFVGAHVPGINRNDWAGLHETARAEGTFVSGDWRASFEAGRFVHRPLTWFQTYGWLGTTPLDAAVFQVSPPDADGRCSLGVASDLAPAVLARSVFKVALVNPFMPRVQGASFPLSDFDLVVEAEHPLLTYDAGALDPAFDIIKGRLQGLIPTGASVQFGIGKAGIAALAALEGMKGLRIHSGMVTDPLLPVLDSGALSEVVTGMAAGSAALYARCGADSRIRFEPASVTHDIRVLAAIPRLVAVNSAIEIDLFGQANAEFQTGRQISGVGGLTDFLRGARLSEGGLPILALPASARRGEISRIVPRLPPVAVSVPRADVGLVITEHGVADLRGLTLDGRAEALIGIAEPAHRDGLANAWTEIRRGL